MHKFLTFNKFFRWCTINQRLWVKFLLWCNYQICNISNWLKASYICSARISNHIKIERTKCQNLQPFWIWNSDEKVYAFIIAFHMHVLQSAHAQYIISSHNFLMHFRVVTSSLCDVTYNALTRSYMVFTLARCHFITYNALARCSCINTLLRFRKWPYVDTIKIVIKIGRLRFCLLKHILS